EALFRQALKVDSTNAYAMNDLGYSLAEQNKNLDEALQLTQRAVDAQPKNASFFDTIGWVCFKMGKLDDAEKYLVKATQTGTKSPAIFEHLGDVFKERGNSEHAIEAWKTALSLATDPGQVSSLKAKLDLMPK
ncbi:MAG TPA: tetratricopeptide repeat protein, partial [Blastocatellia bacterium]